MVRAFQGEISEPNRIGHPAGHMFRIAKGIVRPERIPNGGKRLVHYGPRLGIADIGSRN